jgi:hypothetical protein
MLEKIATLLETNESLSLNIENKGKDSNNIDLFDVIIGFKPKAIPKSLKENSFDKITKAELVEKTKVLQTLRAEIAKPRILSGSAEEIESQLDELLTYKENPTVKKLNNVFDSGLDALNELISGAEEKLTASSKAKTKTTTTKASTVAKKTPPKATVKKTEKPKETPKVVSEPKTETSVSAEQFNLLDSMSS